MNRHPLVAAAGPAASTPAAAAPLFTAVSLGRASAAIVEQIRVLLRDGRLAPGDRLPSERELCQQFGVSRVTVREALRILETGGLITIKVGARGGAFVTSPTSDQVGAGLADLVSLSPLTAGEVAEARSVFELGILPLVIERATDDDVKALRAMSDEHVSLLKQGQFTVAMSAEFHIAVAACTHNTAILMLVQSFHGPLLMSALETKTSAPPVSRAGCLEHVALATAISDRDVARAEEIMRGHLKRAIKRVKATARAV